MSRPTAERRRPVSRPELEGFRDGLRHALALARSAGDADLEGEQTLRMAEHLLREGRLREAERGLVDLDRRRRAAVPERVVSERPRGLVSYVVRGGAEVPTPEEEDPLANRLIFLKRLVALRASEGWEVGPATATLNSATEALRSEDRTKARNLGDEAARLLETPTRTCPDRRAPRTPGREA